MLFAAVREAELAHRCRFRRSALWSLTEGKQTCRGHAKIDANDPKPPFSCKLEVATHPDFLDPDVGLAKGGDFASEVDE
jgi:hypothetical protein